MSEPFFDPLGVNSVQTSSDVEESDGVSKFSLQYTHGRPVPEVLAFLVSFFLPLTLKLL